MKPAIKISIITVCKNREDFLEETISSVANQTYKHIEYIIIDGKSTDSSVEIIKKYSGKIYYWISEEDEGMYYAINKGLKKTTGHYILILNSDDVLVSNTIIEEVVEEINKDELDYYYGNIIKVKPNSVRNVKLYNVNFTKLLMATHGTLLPHCCFFISAGLNNVLNGYDFTYKYASDYDYILRALKYSKRGRYINKYITRFRCHPNSISSGGKIESERKAILVKFGYHKIALFKRYVYFYSVWLRYKLINFKVKGIKKRVLPKIY